MFGSHALATSVCSLDLGLFLFAFDLNLLILRLESLEFHDFHVDNHGSAINSPQVERFFKFTSIELDETLLEFSIHLCFLCDR